MYGYKDSNDVAPGAQGGKFGLNTGAHITKFEYNANAGAGGAAQDAIDLTIQVGEREYRKRFFPISKVYAKGDGGEITDTNSEEYKIRFKEEAELFNATISDIVKVFISEEDLKAALSTPMSSFADFARVVTRLVQQSSPSWQKVPVDVFLQYQYKPGEGKDRSYLELPSNVKHGSFVSKSFGSGWTEEKTETTLAYTRGEEQHPFKRGKWYVESPFANQIVISGGAAMNGDTGSNSGSSSQGAGGW